MALFCGWESSVLPAKNQYMMFMFRKNIQSSHASHPPRLVIMISNHWWDLLGPNWGGTPQIVSSLGRSQAFQRGMFTEDVHMRLILDSTFMILEKSCAAACSKPLPATPRNGLWRHAVAAGARRGVYPELGVHHLLQTNPGYLCAPGPLWPPWYVLRLGDGLSISSLCGPSGMAMASAHPMV